MTLGAGPTSEAILYVCLKVNYEKLCNSALIKKGGNPVYSRIQKKKSTKNCGKENLGKELLRVTTQGQI